MPPEHPLLAELLGNLRADAAVLSDPRIEHHREHAEQAQAAIATHRGLEEHPRELLDAFAGERMRNERNDRPVRGREGVEQQMIERRRRVDDDLIVALGDGRLGEGAREDLIVIADAAMAKIGAGRHQIQPFPGRCAAEFGQRRRRFSEQMMDAERSRRRASAPVAKPRSPKPSPPKPSPKAQ